MFYERPGMIMGDFFSRHFILLINYEKALRNFPTAKFMRVEMMEY